MKKNELKIIWMGFFPEGQSNLGDQAQTLAVEKFFKEHFPNTEVVGFDRGQSQSHEDLLKISDIVNEGDLIFIHSSGDFGSKSYPKPYGVRGRKKSYHYVRRRIISMFPNNKIFHLPTTVWYSSDKTGESTLKEDQEFYKDKKNFLLMCREDVSYEIIAKNIECESKFFPDFVFYLTPTITNVVRDGAILNLRTDRESRFDKKTICEIEKLVQRSFPKTKSKNIHKLPKRFSNKNREDYTNKMFSEYQHSQVVITDQMHSMIFAVINKTPCIALDDAIPHKLSGYKNILSKSVKFAENIADIPHLIEQISSEEYQETNLSEYYIKLKKQIEHLIENKKYENGN